MKCGTESCVQIHYKSCDGTRWIHRAGCCHSRLLLNNCHLCTIAISYRWNSRRYCRCTAIIIVWWLQIWKLKTIFIFSFFFLNFVYKLMKYICANKNHTIAGWWRIGGGGAGFRCGGKGGAKLLVLTCGLRSLVNDKLLALPILSVYWELSCEICIDLKWNFFVIRRLIHQYLQYYLSLELKRCWPIRRNW